MKITKYAHACLLVEEDDVRIIVDPGTWNETPSAENIHALLITHEHQDHFAVEQVKELIARHPDVVIITHAAVAKLITDAGIGANVVVLEEGGSAEVNGVSVQSFGREHAVVYGTSPCRNTGFLIGGKLFIPGDALHDIPNVAVEVLALPTGGPWMKIAEAIDYAKAVKPEVVFPIHDAMYTDDYKRGFVPMIVGARLGEVGIVFRDMPEGASEEF